MGDRALVGLEIGGPIVDTVVMRSIFHQPVLSVSKAIVPAAGRGASIERGGVSTSGADVVGGRGR